MKPFEIFKAGRHTAQDGATLTFAESDLAASAAAYDPALHEAPIVVGHPRSDDPAYGWVGGLAAAAGRLVAAPRQVDAAFAELVAKGAYKKVSASFYMPDAPNNPKPGVFYLRHVGFLGAQPPAVKGLRSIQFADGEAGTVTVEFGESELAWSLSRVARLFRRLKEFLAAEYGQEKADQVIESWEIDAMTEEAARAKAEASPQGPSFADPNPQSEEVPEVKDDIKAREDKIAAEQDALDKEREALAKERAEFAEAKRRADATAAVEALVNDGKVLPAEKDGLIAFMSGLDAEGTVQFGEGDKAKKTPAAFFLEFLTALPKRVDFAERSAEGADEGADGNDPAAIATAAVAYQEEMRGKGVVVATDHAVRHVIEQRNKG